MDILYLIGENTSKCEYNELRYSLRSIEKFGKNVGRIYVGGYCPEWLNDNVYKVSVKQIYEKPSNIVKKHINMLATILYVVDNTDISDDFLVSMDDHFYIKEVDFDNYPIYCKLVEENGTISSNIYTPYGKFIDKTKKFLESQNLPIYYLTLHRNMHCSRNWIKECRNILDKIIKEEISCEHMIFILNYIYNKHPFDFTIIKDVKIKSSKDWEKVNPNDTECFSTSDFQVNSFFDRKIKELYPIKSKYEL